MLIIQSRLNDCVCNDTPCKCPKKAPFDEEPADDKSFEGRLTAVMKKNHRAHQGTVKDFYNNQNKKDGGK